MGIQWKWEYKIQTLEWEWEGMGINCMGLEGMGIAESILAISSLLSRTVSHCRSTERKLSCPIDV